MPADHLHALAEEIRAYLVENVPGADGHLGALLGMVELTIALHRVFDSPADTIVFDGDHQAHPHKLLTGQPHGGASGSLPHLLRVGFRNGMSKCGAYFTPRVSTALAYADGLAKVDRLLGRTDGAMVGVVDDAALSSGLALEGLNDLADADRRVIIVLNDNERGGATGGLAAHLRTLRATAIIGPECHTCGTGSLGGNVFTHLGLAYLGPVDGHDVAACERALRNARALRRPVVVHLITHPGLGYRPAEADLLNHLHGRARINPAAPGDTDPAMAAGSPEPSWTNALAAEMCAIGAEREDVVAVTTAIGGQHGNDGMAGLAEFAKRFPDRIYQVGLADQHAACSVAGLALGGLHPVVAGNTPSLTQTIAQVLMDPALRRLPVTLVLGQAAIPGGPSHGAWDPSILGIVPGIRIAAPRDPARLRELLREAISHTDGPTVLRYPQAHPGPGGRNSTGGSSSGDRFDASGGIEAVSVIGDDGKRMGGVDVLHHHGPNVPARDQVLLVAAGALAGACLRAARVLERHDVGVTVVDPRWVVPIHPALPILAAQYGLVVTVENSSRIGGAGALLAQACIDAAVHTPVRNLGLPRAFAQPSRRGDPLDDASPSGAAIADAVIDFLATRMKAGTR